MKLRGFLIASKQAVGLMLPLVGVSVFSQAEAAPLAKELPALLAKNNTIRAAEFDRKSAKESLKQAVAAWYPSVDVTIEGGYEKQKKAGTSADTSLGFNEEDLELDQLIYDFGATSAAIQSAKIGYWQSKATLETTRQATLLQGINAYTNLVKAKLSVGYAKISRDSVARQLRIEMMRVRSGSGFSTDVLEARAKLQNMQSLLVQAQGNLIAATNAYRAVFRRAPGPLNEYATPALPMKKLPKTLDEALQEARNNNLQLKVLRYAEASSREAVRTAKAAFYPSLDASAHAKKKYNVGGTAGKKQEYLAKVTLTYPLFAGFSDLAGLRAARYNLRAAQNRLAETQYVVEETTRNAWQQLQTARQNSAFRAKQALQLKQFLTLAQKERRMGRRTLVDVLVAETNYNNALNANADSRANIVTAAYSLLQAVGRLTLGSVEDAQHRLPTAPKAHRPGLKKPVHPVDPNAAGAVPMPPVNPRNTMLPPDAAAKARRAAAAAKARKDLKSSGARTRQQLSATKAAKARKALRDGRKAGQ